MNKQQQQFHDWLTRQGAQLLPATNPYEYARFIAHGATHVIYEGRRGISAGGFAAECLEAFRNGANLGMGFARKARSSFAKQKLALLQRDGSNCFFCLTPMAENEITVEHLVARGKGGPDHLDNLALAHLKCNREADNLPLMKKLEIREAARRKMSIPCCD